MRHDTLTRGSTLLAAMLLCGCADMLGLAGETPAPPAPPDPAVLAAQALTSHLALVQRLIESAPDAQAQIVATVKHQYDLAPTTPDDELDYALVLAAPGHAGSDPAHARQILSDLLGTQASLMPPERALAVMVLHDVDERLDLATMNQRLKTQYQMSDRLREAQASRRLDTEIARNRRLRRDLAQARAKLKAIANIERSLLPHPPAKQGKTP